MKSIISLKKIIRKFFAHFRLHVKFYPSARYIYNYLIDQPEIIQINELIIISNILKANKDQNFYNELLRLFIPNWRIRIKQSQFIGSGKGIASLNTYRKVDTLKKTFFEKVYFTSAIELTTIKWLSDNEIYKHLKKDGINIPELQDVYRGNILTIVYFNFMQLIPVKENSLKEMIILTKLLYRSSLDPNIIKIIESAPKSLKDVRNHFQYKKHIVQAKEHLNRNNINSSDIEGVLQNSILVFSHGDIQKSNIYMNNSLIDWDSFGIYPLGLDIALLFNRWFSDIEDIEIDILTWLTENYSKTIEKSDWKMFELSFAYFLFIFHFNAFRNSSHKNIETQLLGILKRINFESETE